MKDMSIIANKKIINKETNEVRLVVSIDEENRKIHSVPVDEPNAEPSIMAAASYDRRHAAQEHRGGSFLPKAVELQRKVRRIPAVLRAPFSYQTR